MKKEQYHQQFVPGGLKPEEIKELKNTIEQKRFGNNISSSELNLAEWQLKNKIKKEKLDPLKPSDWKKIVSNRKEIKFLDKKLREK